MRYHCVAGSVVGFVQQLAACYLPHGYWFYVSGVVPFGKDPAVVDAKLLAKYGISLSRSARARRKAIGIANVHYLRHGRRFLLLATHGFHQLYDDEAKSLRDARRVPIKFEGYSISVAKGGFLRKLPGGNAAAPDHRWRVRVQIERETYKGLKAYFMDVAVHRAAEALVAELRGLPFEPYAPVRQQLLNIVRLINRRRHAASLEAVNPRALRFRRRIVRPFEPSGTAESSVMVLLKASCG